MVEYYIYIMTNQYHTTLYMGMTKNLYHRVKQHQLGKGGKFISKNQLTKLVQYEVFDYVYDALEREKQIKGGSRQKKIDLVNEMNPAWLDLFEQLQF